MHRHGGTLYTHVQLSNVIGGHDSCNSQAKFLRRIMIKEASTSLMNITENNTFALPQTTRKIDHFLSTGGDPRCATGIRILHADSVW